MDHAHIPNSMRRQAGIALLVIVAIVAILALAVFAKWAMSDAQRRLGQNTGINKVLNKAELALASFVAQHRRLPCPADGRMVSNTANVGLELASCVAQAHGVLPWVTLGLSEDEARDPWGARLTYRVDPALTGTVVRLMDMSNCDISGAGSVAGGGACRSPTPTCVANPTSCTSPSTFLAGKGLDVWDGAGGAGAWTSRVNNRVLGSGAAYVLISHGETGAGAYNARGILQPGTIGVIASVPPPGTQIAGDDEIPNFANLGLNFPATQANTYRAARYSTGINPSHFDDHVRHPTISEVLKKASLQDRIH